MPVVDVTPYGLWPKAKYAEVEGGKPDKKVPIIRIRWTPVELFTVRKAQYPNGVVILNDVDLPSDANPYPLTLYTETKDIHSTIIPKGNEWPEGMVVLFRRGTPSNEASDGA